MEKIGSLLKKAEPGKSLQTMQQPSQPQWAGILWTLAQSRTKELTSAEVALWKAKLSGYSGELVEWALIAYNGEFFPNPSTICRMIEVKQESIFIERQNAEWEAYKANQKQAEREGRLMTEADYEKLRDECRQIMAKAPVITAAGRPRKSEQANTNAAASDGTGKAGSVERDGEIHSQVS